MHVLVTGASGFIGSHLCEESLKRGFMVTALSHNSSKNTELHLGQHRKGFQVVPCDIVREKDVTEAFKQLKEPVDCVFHLAGQMYQKHLPPEVYFQRNSIGTLHVLECCRIFDVKRVILSSTIAVYGLPYKQFTPEYLPIDEKHKLKIHPGDFYGLSKLFAEQFCKSYYDIYGIITAVLRISRVYGPGLSKGSLFEIYAKALSNESIIFETNAYTDAVYVDDVVRANLESFESVRQFEVYNIGSGEEMTLKEICLKIIELTRSSSRVNFNTESKTKFSLDISKAKTEIGYNPIKMEKGLMKWLSP
jgi:UDP-glucose 4-epimerase